MVPAMLNANGSASIPVPMHVHERLITQEITLDRPVSTRSSPMRAWEVVSANSMKGQDHLYPEISRYYVCV